MTMRVLFVVKEPIMHDRLGVMYLSAALKSHGHEARLVLANPAGLKGIRKIMDSYSPAIVGYSAMTGEHMKLLELNRTLKKDYKFLAVFGGPHATFFPELIREDGCDAVCVGEGEIALAEFCRRVSNNEAYWQAPNFIVKHNGDIIHNPLLPLIENLDELPFPDRDVMYEADPSLINETHKTFFSMRGCPYSCTYCFNRKYNEIYKGKGRSLRIRSPENLINEICSVRKRYPLKIVLIDDDIFILKPMDWFKRFCALYKERVKLPLSCNIRANLVTEELIAMLKDAGLDSVWMGIECANEEISDRVLERKLKNAELIAASNTIRNHSIKLCTQNLIGLPVKHSYQTDLQTLDFNIKIRPAFAWSSILYPYPGTPVESYARTHGFLEKEAPFFETNKRASVFSFSKKQKRQIENLHKMFGLIVRFPFLRKFCNFLCDLPLTGLYNGLYYLWYGYIMKIKLYPFFSFKKELGNYMRLWYSFIRKT